MCSCLLLNVRQAALLFMYIAGAHLSLLLDTSKGCEFFYFFVESIIHSISY